VVGSFLSDITFEAYVENSWLPSKHLEATTRAAYRSYRSCTVARPRLTLGEQKPCQQPRPALQGRGKNGVANGVRDGAKNKHQPW
jgi:hypothetical protein